MSPRPAKFRQADVTRALKAAKAAGLPIARCEIDADGKIVIVADTGVAYMETAAPVMSAYERWKAKHDGAAKQGRG